jgi:bacterioferritin-associated ferredoxin
MIVCHCESLTDRQLRAAVRAGARSCADLMQACGAGTGCGGCKPALEELLVEERPRAGAIARGREVRLPLVQHA